MALRTIKYTVNANGIDPPTLQPGGMQGEHAATELEFKLESSFADALLTKAGDNKLVYRIESHTGAGTKNSTQSKELDEKSTIIYPLENWLTKDGGNIRVYLIISILTASQTLMDLYSFPALINLTAVPDAYFDDGSNYKSLSLLSVAAMDAAKNAAISAENANASQENAAALSENAKQSANLAALAAQRTENARAALENGTEFIFDGGNAESTLGIEFVVDNYITPNSTNPVTGAAIYLYIQSVLANAKLEAHPVGSYYFSTLSTDPAELFGGVWERVSDKFILAAGETYPAGSVGGSAAHSHTLSDLGYALIGQSSKESRSLAYNTTEVGGSAGLTATHRAQCASLIEAASDETIGYVTQLGGSTDALDNIPPYEAAYCWKRTE